jgi:hypothetical protein
MTPSPKSARILLAAAVGLLSASAVLQVLVVSNGAVHKSAGPVASALLVFGVIALALSLDQKARR